MSLHETQSWLSGYCLVGDLRLWKSACQPEDLEFYCRGIAGGDEDMYSAAIFDRGL